MSAAVRLQASRPVSPLATREAAVTRVAAVIDTAEVSGPGRQLAALALALRARGVEVLVVMFHRTGRPRPPYAAYLDRAGVRVAVVAERGRVDLRALGALRDVLTDFAPSVVQTHSYKTTVLAALLRVGGARWPWVAFFHGATAEDWKVRLYTWLDNRLLGRADAVVVMSAKHAREFARFGAKVRVVHNAVLPLPSEADDVRVPASASGLPLLGVVGRLSPEKGVDVFLDACALLVRRGVAFAAVLAGDGPERERLAAQRDALGLGDRVHFIGAVTAVQALYARLDLLVIPSRSEGLPNVLLEALRCDVPAVATRVGAVPEVLGETPAGVLVEPGSAQALADAIAASLGLKADGASRAARRAIVDRFSVDARVAAHVALYADALAARRGGRA